jgi:site-specific recombinase XerD
MTTTPSPELLTEADALAETTPACPAVIPGDADRRDEQETDVWDRLKAMVLDGVTSPHSRRSYETALNEFFHWWNAEGRPPFVKATVQAFRARLESDGLAPATINVRISAIRKLAMEATDNGLLDPALAAGIARVKGVTRLGVRLGNWLTLQQAQALLAAPDATTVKGKRDQAILAVLLGCALRRSEVAGLTAEQIQQRDGRWVIPDLIGKGGRVRTVPMPVWVKLTIDAWLHAAGIASGRIWLAINKGGRPWGSGFSEKAVWSTLERYAAEVGLPNIAPHDLRRTCAKLCRAAGGELEQIQLLLGHASVQTTERYLGTKQNLTDAPNDHLGLVLQGE